VGSPGIDARITRLKDGRTRLAYKPEHAVDLDTEAIVAATIHPADQGDTTTIAGTLEAATRGLDAAGLAPSAEAPAELVADKGYHSRAVLKDLADGPWQTRIAEPRPKEVSAGTATSCQRGVPQSRPPALGDRQGASLRARWNSCSATSAAAGRTWLRPGERPGAIKAATYTSAVMRALLGAGLRQGRRCPRRGLYGWLLHRLARHPHHRAAKHPTRPDRQRPVSPCHPENYQYL
jgi:hypothetical protein